MLKGIHLTLLMGPVAPSPVSQEVLDALTSIEVTTRDVGASGFQLSFTLSTRSPLHMLFLLAGSSPIPFVRVVIIVTHNGTSYVLIDGVVTNHQVTSGEGGHATLSLTGEDLTAVMNLLDFSGFPYPAVPAEGRVALMIAKYSFLGIVPLILPSPMIDVVFPTARIFSQNGTDLDYINELAENVGYVFYIDPGPEPGMNVAYWGPQFKISRPQPALNINMDAHTNVESLNFTFDKNSKGLPIVTIFNEATRLLVPIPMLDISPLSPPLGLIPPLPMHDYRLDTSRLSPTQAVLIGMAKAAKLANAVKGEGSLDVLRYGHILKARNLVGVRGAGLAFDGLYYVSSVTHKIKRGEYKQNFSLVRNGLISTLQQVEI